jgi:hypothetical protein
MLSGVGIHADIMAVNDLPIVRVSHHDIGLSVLRFRFDLVASIHYRGILT